jgi:hypothetical protein
MTIGAKFRLEEDDGEQSDDLVANPDMMRRHLEQVLVEMAAARDMSQFDREDRGAPDDDIDPDEDC